MAHPFAVEGAMKSDDRPFGRALRDFFTARTRSSVLMRTHRSTSSGAYGTAMCDAISMRSASGQRASTS